MKKICTAIVSLGVFVWVSSGLNAQSIAEPSNNVKINYGVSFDLRWEIVYKYGYLSNFRLGIGAGIGAKIGKNLMPYSQYTIAIFQGGMGSSISVAERHKLNIESLFTFGAVTGTVRDSLLYSRPLYSMGILTPTPLTNPFNSYFNLATTYIFRFNKPTLTNAYGVKHRFNQRVGSVSVGDTHWDLHYFNDGTPFHWMGLGDGKDRYWTGGGFLSVHLKNSFDNKSESKNAIRRVFLGFDRFTGYHADAFEVANNLGLGFVPYADPKQAFYNKGRIYGGVELASIPGFMPSFTLLDHDKLDIQNIIHKSRGQSFHKTFHHSSYGLNLYYKANYWDLQK